MCFYFLSHSLLQTLTITTKFKIGSKLHSKLVLNYKGFKSLCKTTTTSQSIIASAFITNNKIYYLAKMQFGTTLIS